MTSPDLPAKALLDCEICTGTGVMTARSVSSPPHAPATLIICPVCDGRGATVVGRPNLRAVPNA